MPRYSRRYQGRINRQHIHGATCSESEHQQALISWARDTAELQDDELLRQALTYLHHIANGGSRGKPFVTKKGIKLPPFEAVLLKAEGVVAAINDLRLDYRATHSNVVYSGIIAEMKAGKEPLKPHQAEYQRYMFKQGFVCCTWYTWQRAAQDITRYLTLSRIAPVWMMIESTRAIQINTVTELLDKII